MDQSPRPDSARATTEPAAQGAPAIDLRGVDACHSVPAAILGSAGLDASTAVDRSNAVSRGCRWTSADRATSLQLIVNSHFDLTILAEASPQRYEEYVLEGYPAVKEALPGSFLCTIYVEASPGQIISVDFGTTADVSPESVCPTTERLALDLMRAIARAE